MFCNVAKQDLTPRSFRSDDLSELVLSAARCSHPPRPDDRLARRREVRAPTSRTTDTERRGRRSPAGAISGAPRSTGLAASAERFREHSRRGCLSVESEANAASSATGRETEHRRAVGAFSARPPQHDPPPGCACRDARQRRGSGTAPTPTQGKRHGANANAREVARRQRKLQEAVRRANRNSRQSARHEQNYERPQRSDWRLSIRKDRT